MGIRIKPLSLRLMCAAAGGAALLSAASVAAAPGGALGLLTRGNYACELPGDATGAVGRRAPGWDFEITNASSYRTAQGMGVYLLTGDQLAMTSGPLRGERYRRVSSGFLRKLDAQGSETTLRCILTVTNNGD